MKEETVPVLEVPFLLSFNDFIGARLIPMFKKSNIFI